MKDLPLEYVNDLLQRAAAHADPADVERKERLDNWLFVELSRREHPIGSPVWYVLDHRGEVRRVTEAPKWK